MLLDDWKQQEQGRVQNDWWTGYYKLTTFQLLYWMTGSGNSKVESKMTDGLDIIT